MKVTDITETISNQQNKLGFNKEDLADLKTKLVGDGYSGKISISTKPTIRNSNRKKGESQWNGEKSSIVFKRIMDLDSGKIIKRSYTTYSIHGITDASILAYEGWWSIQSDGKLLPYEKLSPDIQAKLDMVK